MENNIRAGFIGCGNMGSALGVAAAKSGAELLLSNRTAEKMQKLSLKTGGICSTNIEIAESCDYIFLGVKPQMMGDVLGEIADTLKCRNGGFVLVTMAAGLDIQTIRRMAGGEYPVIRIMPNTPSSIGCGMTLYCSQGTTERQIDEFCSMMKTSGSLDLVDERLINAGSAVSGCGPAFVYQFIEALADGAVACGLPRQKAIMYAAQTLTGAAQMVLQSGKHPGELKDAVCSPGGSTIQGVRALEESGFRAAAMNAVIAAYDKTVELGK